MATYRNAQNKEEKREMERLIAEIKSDFRSEIANNDPKIKRKAKLGGQLYNLTMQTGLFEASAKEKKDREKKIEKIETELEKLTAEIEEIKNNKIYENAFEWRFEFPEVLNESGDFVGFDVVIGNPPYIRQEEFSSLKPYLLNNFKTFAGTADLYVYFVELSMNLLRNLGNFIFIIPNKWMRAGYGKPLREFIENFEIKELLDFGDLQVFEEATTYPLIIGLTKSYPSERFTAVNLDTLSFPKGMHNYLNENRIDVLVKGLASEGWTLTDSKSQKLLLKLKSKGVPLSEYLNGKIFYGIKTGFNEAFVIDQKTKDQLIAEDDRSAEIIKPFLAGRDIKRYQQPKNKKYLIFTRRGIEIENYPAILSYLEGFKERLEPKPLDFKGDKWKGRKPGSYKWYEIQDAVDYYEEFEKEKLMLPDISIKAESVMDNYGMYCVNTAYIIPKADKYLLALINSSLIHFFYSNLTSTIRGGYLRFIRQYLAQIPVIEPSLELRKKIEELVSLILEAKKKSSLYNTSDLESEIDHLVYGLYGLTEEEIRIVEGGEG